MITNKDPSNAHEVKIAFEENGKDTRAQFSGAVQTATFGAAEYVWKPSGPTSHADPAGPAKRATVKWKDGQTVELPKASVTVLTGKVSGR